MLHKDAIFQEKLYRKAAEVSHIITSSLLIRIDSCIRLMLLDDLYCISNEIEKEILKYKQELTVAKEDDIQINGPLGKLLYFFSLLKYVMQPLFMALLIIITIIVSLFWVYSLVTSSSDIDKLIIIINGLSAFAWILSIFAGLEIISESTLTLSRINISKIIVSLLVWVFPVTYLFSPIYGAIAFIVLNFIFLFFVLPRFRGKK